MPCICSVHRRYWWYLIFTIVYNYQYTCSNSFEYIYSHKLDVEYNIIILVHPFVVFKGETCNSTVLLEIPVVHFFLQKNNITILQICYKAL